LTVRRCPVGSRPVKAALSKRNNAIKAHWQHRIAKKIKASAITLRVGLHLVVKVIKGEGPVASDGLPHT
jgi:hypothetical protein